MNGSIDQAKAEAFAGWMMTPLNDASLGMLVSIGRQTRLFDTMAASRPRPLSALPNLRGFGSATCGSGWGGMVLGRIVSYDPATKTYFLPAEHAAFLTRSAGSNSLAFFTQYIRLLSAVEGDVIRAFREGGGVSYEKYPDFQRLQAEESAALYDTALVEAILPSAEEIVERLRSGIDVIDLGTGQGHAVNVMARAFPESRFLGVDFSAEGIEAARAEAASWKLPNARFKVADIAAGLPAAR